MKSSKLVVILFAIFVVLALLFAGLQDGMVYPMNPIATALGMRRAAMGVSETFRMVNADKTQYILSWRVGLNQAFMCVDKFGTPANTLFEENEGALLSTRNMDAFRNLLENIGWTYIGATSLPTAITKSMMSFGSFASVAQPTIIIVPVSMFKFDLRNRSNQ